MTIALRALLVALIASCLRCGKTPTEPSVSVEAPTPRPTPAPTPVPGQLSGDWSGTLTSGSCSENVQVKIDDQNGSLDASFAPSPPRCAFAGQFVWFTGTDRGGTIDVTLYAGDSTVAELGGPASLTSINIRGGSGTVKLDLSR